MKLTHFSKADSITVESREQRDSHRHKPDGFWVSDESEHGWSAWIESEGLGWLDGATAFDVALSPDATILMLRDVLSLVAFDREFCRNPNDRFRIDWRAVAQRWQGIIISPYQWGMRLGDIDWYYTWDCASGCIWDVAAIASVTSAVEAVA